MKLQSGQLTAQDAAVVIDTSRVILDFFGLFSDFREILKLLMVEFLVKLQSGQLTAQDAVVVIDTSRVIFDFFGLFSDFREETS